MGFSKEANISVYAIISEPHNDTYSDNFVTAPTTSPELQKYLCADLQNCAHKRYQHNGLQSICTL